MRILIFYRPNSEFARGVETFVHDFTNRHSSLADRVELLDYDSREGTELARIHDVLAHPAILLLREDGSLLKDWRQDSLPPIDEVANYAYSIQ
jgi:hypothetical protein